LGDNNDSVLRKDDFRCELQLRKVKVCEVDASKFLSFAKQDIRENSERGRTNALSNVNRAISCRVDQCLTLFNCMVFSSRERWNLPYKMMVLQTFGVPTPDILRRLISSKRNVLEHKYSIPKEQQEVQDAVELAELFLEASRPYVEKGYIASAILTQTSWFKPGDLAPTWFGRGIGEYTSRRYEYHDGFSTRYELVFDLNKALTLSYSDNEVYGRCDLKTGEKMVKGVPIKEKGPFAIPILEFDMQEVKELMILLRERAREA